MVTRFVRRILPLLLLGALGLSSCVSSYAYRRPGPPPPPPGRYYRHGYGRPGGPPPPPPRAYYRGYGGSYR